MPEIFHVISDMTVGGAGIFLSHLLSDRKEQAGSLVLLPTGSLLCSRLAALDIPYETFPSERERSFSLSGMRALKERFRKGRPDLLVSHASLSARVAAKSLGIPTLSIRHCDTAVRPLSVPFYNALTDATVATSRPAAIRLRVAGVKNVLMIENGVTDMGPPCKEARKGARKALGLPDNSILIGLSGRLAPIKGHATAIEALALLGERGKAFSLCFLGEGEEKDRLIRLAKARGVADRVLFLGYLPDPKPFYHAIDAHISCSLGSETSSLALAEGLSAASPTFASDTPGNRERLGEGGMLFPVGDAKALARLFLSLENERERNRLSALARARSTVLPDWPRVRREYAAIFGAFCGELAAKGCNFRKDML